MVATLFPSVTRASLLTDFINSLDKPATAYADTAHPSVTPIGAASSSGNIQTMSMLKPAMNINPAPATGGGGITVVNNSALLPQEGPSGTIADIVKPKNGTIRIHVVQPGDTLSSIAALSDVPLTTILWANDLTKTSAIHVGDKLVILPVPGIQHVVKKGDTLETIATKYGSNAADIGNYNGIDDASLVVGSTILVPDGELSNAQIAVAAGTPAKTSTPKKKHSSGSLATGTAQFGPEPAHNVGPSGTATQISYYIAPLSNYIKTQGIHGYNAVDLAAPVGTPIMASADGEVIVAREGGWNGGYGSYVVISHDNGSQTLYSHMSSVTAYDGEAVSQGDVIGYVGRSGEATGPHLHFEIRDGIKNPF